MLDQASKLRALMNNNDNRNKQQFISNNKFLNNTNANTKVFTIASGKGGVGKSNFVVNLSLALSKKGYKVLIFDADIGMSNDHVLMRLKVTYNIFDLLIENLNIEDIIVESIYGVDLISSGSALNKIYSMDEREREFFLTKLSSLSEYDYILIDTGAGINKDILSFISACDDFIVLTTPEPTAITDAYSLIKTVNYFKIKENVNIVINKALYRDEGISTFERIKNVCDKFLQLELNYTGCILEDRKLVESVRQQIPVYISHPNSTSSKNIEEIAFKICKMEDNNSKQGLQGFFKKIFKLVK